MKRHSRTKNASRPFSKKRNEPRRKEKIKAGLSITQSQSAKFRTYNSIAKVASDIALWRP